MTLATTDIDLFLAEVFLGYLSLPHADWMALLGRPPTDATRAVDIPDSLVRVGMNPGKDAVYPSLLIAASEAKGNTSGRKVMDVFCYLQTWLKPTDAGTANVTRQSTVPQVSAIQVAVKNRLRDAAAFYAYLGTLPAEQREGWQICSRLQIANAGPERDKKTGSVDFVVGVSLLVALSRLGL